MTSRTRLLAPLALAALAGCQDYNFSPANYCLIQPGTERVTLSDISTADILFVVDDSGSMGGEQANLASSFSAFVQQLADTNQSRKGAQLEPIDFHIAVTTTSVFFNTPVNGACSATCSGLVGQNVCCDKSTRLPVTVPKSCTTAADCKAGGSCLTTCQGRAGELTCCAAANATPERVNQPCPTVGADCGVVNDRYVVTRGAVLCPNGNADCDGGQGFTCKTTCTGLVGQSACCDSSNVTQRIATCQIGLGTEGGLYPRGDFVRAGSNPRVLHFTKDLNWAAAGTDPAIQALVTQFKANVNVGTCGSGQEQALEAARRAVQKALHQNGQSQPADVLPSDWPHDKSKLVVVFVGDEDDCSAPEDPNLGIIMAPAGQTDACVLDASAQVPRAFPVADYASYFASLGRPLAGAVVASSVDATCGIPLSPGGTISKCTAGICGPTQCTLAAASCSGLDCYTCSSVACTDPDPLLCGGQGKGFRLYAMADAFGGKGADVVTGSICVTDFSPVLKRVADIVKQPTGLQLPTQPASDKLTILRITDRSGKTRKTCRGPAPQGLSKAGATAAGWDWWFTSGNDLDGFASTGASKFVYINRTTLSCTANPGETYSADYLGLLPREGCASNGACALALGGRAVDLGDPVDDWSCCDGLDASGQCIPPAAPTVGTCLCNAGSTGQ